MAGESVTPFIGHENFAAALLLYAQSLEEPNDFKTWNRMTKSLAQYYDDAPEHPWPHDNNAYNAMRVETFLATHTDLQCNVNTSSCSTVPNDAGVRCQKQRNYGIASDHAVKLRDG